MMRNLFLFFIVNLICVGCNRHHYHCYCTVLSSNHESYLSDYGTRFTYHERKYQNSCKANEQKQGIDKCSLQ